MKDTHRSINDWALRLFAIEKARGLHTSDKTLSEIYEMLTDEQKIAFILAGGTVSLPQWQQVKTDSGRETGLLPVMC